MGPGQAWLRTNIGYAAITRSEIIAEVHDQIAPLGKDWFDLPMVPGVPGTFEITLGLSEVGHFEAKSYFLPAGSDTPLWPPGNNTAINVAPAETCCANIIYNTFVRQFGPNKSGAAEPDAARAACITSLDQAGYAVIPKSGTFRDLIAELDFIIYHLECRYIHLLPIHPTPTTYARMGRFGSPYAALSFTAVDPALAEFDPRKTPLEQFIELVNAVHARQARLILDIAPNHTGWAASLHETHPQWLARESDGRIEVPGAWGVRWEDLTRLDYSHKGLWRYMAEVFITWCRRGVDGFRCDAGYMIPVAAWRYITARVREQYPDTIFFLEGLGGKISVTRDILNRAGFDWAYSELFQNYDRGAISHYLPEALDISQSDGLTVHFAETHDNNRLAATSHRYARMRTALCALLCQQGGFGFASGVEWLATAKIVVHEASSLNWGAAINQVDAIKRLNVLLKIHPAFHAQTHLQLVQRGPGNHLVLLRRHIPTRRHLLVVVNLDTEASTAACWSMPEELVKGAPPPEMTDLLSGRRITPYVREHGWGCDLAQGEVFCLSTEYADLENLEAALGRATPLPPRLRWQGLRARVLAVYQAVYGTQHLDTFDVDQAAQRLADDPAAFVKSLNGTTTPPGLEITAWCWPADARREVMLAPGHFLLVQVDTLFRARLADAQGTLCQQDSFPAADGRHYALFAPLPTPATATPLTLKLTRLHVTEGSVHIEAPLLALAPASSAQVQTVFTRRELLHQPLMYLKANPRGTLTRAPVAWSTLTSRYDALLAANPAPDYPAGRRIMFSRCRAWIVYQGFSYQLQLDCLQQFCRTADGRGLWCFQIPCGQGQNIRVSLHLRLAQDANAISLTFYRHAGNNAGSLPKDQTVRLVLRPDIEDRDFHAVTKAYLGPQQQWETSVQAFEGGLQFSPDPQRTLMLAASHGQYFSESEWYYMVYRELEAQRGLEAHSDLFSPGYFAIPLQGDQTVTLAAETFAAAPEFVRPSPEDLAAHTACRADQEDLPNTDSDILPNLSVAGAGFKPAPTDTVVTTLTASLRDYVVRRGNLKTVIAGYPWFLDWGRDALIVVRGMIAAGLHDDARAVLQQFGRFEENGTLPNMIDGINAANRDTSDAPLWFFTACRELVDAQPQRRFLDESCGPRRVRETLASIAQNYMRGTSNGIRMDEASGLIYSPGHYTWMDTNHPAGTLRQGYPIEIQALWYAALDFMARIDEPAARPAWQARALQVQQSILTLFWRPEAAFLADCRHASQFVPAAEAVADDALRPNQLLAITMKALTDASICQRVLQACQCLLIPGAIRSLADRPVEFALPVYHHGHLLNDPRHPYQGRYEGDEDTRRKPAYHNGTAWSWPFPSFCEAWYMIHGRASRDTAMAWLASSLRITNRGAAAHLPEVLDGDYPHTPRGCDAQAWGVSEVLRVWIRLTVDR